MSGSFGNAKTTRNDNSSRFGKYMDIEFDFKGDPVGGVITNSQNQGERNFHIFYQMLQGLDKDKLGGLKLVPGVENYDFLNKSGCVDVDARDDVGDFQVVQKGMEIIGFSEEERNQVLQLLASILKLGNVQFADRPNEDGTDGSDIVNAKEVEEVSELLGCSQEVLSCALNQRTVAVRGDMVKTDLNVGDTNSFEQFIINYCNEKLQQIFIELTLKEEQEEYVKEGIEWIHVDYFNNSVICDLIEKNNQGILALLDEECLRPGNTTDSTFLEKMDTRCESHPHYESRRCKKNQSDKTLPHEAFRLRHYAGNGFENFMLKGRPSEQSLKRPATTGSQFKLSVTELMKNLSSKNPNYIRCIKPNDFKKERDFDREIVKHQVYPQFLYRYKMMAPETWPHWEGEPREGVKKILEAEGISNDEYAFGKTKIFIRNPRLARVILRELKLAKRREEAATFIRKIYLGYKARKLLAVMKREKRVLWANGVIHKYYRGWQVRKEIRPRFRRIAGPKVARFMTTALCAKYRANLDELTKHKLKEKMVASNLFKDKKETYSQSVPIPFKGDYVEVDSNQKWQKLYKSTQDAYVVFADTVNKVNRADGKMVSKLLVLSTQSLLVLDPKTLALKYRIPLSLIQKISVSPYKDTLCVFHIHKENGEVAAKKGDFVFSTSHLIEAVTKTQMIVQSSVGKPPEVQILPQIQAEFKSSSVEVNFKKGQGDSPVNGNLKLARKGNRLEVIET
ncbi:unconventional myosin-Ia-like [Elysia marginata]|uniref:Unconventional myosin-Ia-like n=1 Tax=Elysia marginata TaxID=1093978 RepID=A0AAV4F0Q7_9GAST|nr:unconventional myosin-Ia-like [Elysia marginata]